MAASVETAERTQAPPELLPPRRRGLRSGTTLALLCATAMVALGIVVSRSSLFAMTSLEVRGTHHVSRQQLQELAGVDGSTNVLWLSPGAVQRRVLADPWIASAEVRRELPSGITITVHERTAVAVGTDASGGAFLVAGDGVVLGPAPAGTALPAIDVRPATVAPGARVAPGPALRVVVAFTPGLASRVASVSVGQTGVDVRMRSGLRVIYGDASDEVAKARALDAVLGWAAGQDVIPAYVDVSVPSAPALLPVGAATPIPAPESSGQTAPSPSPAPSATARVTATP